jgi:large subunit ribosomal protein L31
MKQATHPAYHPEAKVSCACGNTFVTGSTEAEIKTELCSACHPFYTGKQKLIDTARRVEKFQTKKGLAKTEIRSKKAKLATKGEAKAGKKNEK